MKNLTIWKISDIMNYPVEPSIGYPTPGSFGTWAGIEKQIPTICTVYSIYYIEFSFL